VHLCLLVERLVPEPARALGAVVRRCGVKLRRDQNREP